MLSLSRASKIRCHSWWASSIWHLASKLSLQESTTLPVQIWQSAHSLLERSSVAQAVCLQLFIVLLLCLLILKKAYGLRFSLVLISLCVVFTSAWALFLLAEWVCVSVWLDTWSLRWKLAHVVSLPCLFVLQESVHVGRDELRQVTPLVWF